MMTLLLATRLWQALSWRILLCFPSRLPVVQSCFVFTPGRQPWVASRLTDQRCILKSKSSYNKRNDEESDLEPPPHDFFVVDWDGCLVDTRDWRVQSALAVAKAVWPNLEFNLALPSNATLSAATTSLNHQWLENKLKALSHVFYSPDPQFSLTCEYALATRLLIEEQMLDQGRSIGRTGKYSNRYHPQLSSKIGMQSSSSGLHRSSSSGSRPLTVGEISANWCSGGMLRDTLLTRYHVRYLNPLPQLQAALERHLVTRKWESSTTMNPRLVPEVQQQLQAWHSRRTLIVLVSQASDIPAAIESLAVARIPCRVVPGLTQVRVNSISVLVPTESTLRDLLQACPKGSHVYRISSSWSALESAIPLMGDDVPQQQRLLGGESTGGDGFGRTPYGSNLCLAYADWAATAHPTFHAAATMSPWTRPLTLTEWEELLSFQITRDGRR